MPLEKVFCGQLATLTAGIVAWKLKNVKQYESKTTIMLQDSIPNPEVISGQVLKNLNKRACPRWGQALVRFASLQKTLNPIHQNLNPQLGQFQAGAGRQGFIGDDLLHGRGGSNLRHRLVSKFSVIGQQDHLTGSTDHGLFHGHLGHAGVG